MLITTIVHHFWTLWPVGAKYNFSIFVWTCNLAERTFYCDKFISSYSLLVKFGLSDLSSFCNCNETLVLECFLCVDISFTALPWSLFVVTGSEFFCCLFNCNSPTAPLRMHLFTNCTCQTVKKVATLKVFQQLPAFDLQMDLMDVQSSKASCLQAVVLLFSHLSKLVDHDIQHSHEMLH